jgi:hypothetical protein
MISYFSKIQIKKEEEDKDKVELLWVTGHPQKNSGVAAPPPVPLGLALATLDDAWQPPLEHLKDPP